jgi:hypothetical protein
MPGLPLREAAPTSRTRGVRAIWLARTGGLPGRSLAGYRRWALTPPFHPSPVIGGSTDPSAGLLSVALDVAEGLRPSVPRVVGPSGLCYESGLCSTPRAGSPVTQRRVGRPRPDGLYRTSVGRQLAANADQRVPLLRADPGAPRLPAAEKDDPGRREAQLHPLGALPTLLPARVGADLGVEPHPGSLGL